MSVVYEKSTSDKYKKYFTPEKALEERLTVCSLNDLKPIERQKVIYNSWDAGKAGVPLYWDKKNNTIAVDHTDAHTLVVGPTGSKKSRLIAMPLVRTLGSTGESMIISDPKAEIYNRTAEYLKQEGYLVYVLNMRSPMHGHSWNPLAIPYSFYAKGEIDKACEFVNDIAQNIVRKEQSHSDPFWPNSAGSFFFGVTLLLFKYCMDHNLDTSYIHIGNVVNLRNALFKDSGKGINKELWDYAKKDNIISSALIGTVETASDTRGGILSTFDQSTRMFSVQPNVLDMLGNNDIDFSSIGERPTAVFLIVPDEKTGYHGLVSLFIKQSYEYLIYNAQTVAEQDGFHVGSLKNRLNYILDEFSSLPTISDFPSMITAARSRNIRFTLIIQSKHQLIQRYQEETNTIQTNCNNWVFLNSRELTFLHELSSLCGETTENNPRPVLSIAHLQRLDKEEGEALIFFGRLKPCISHLADITLYDGDHYLQFPIQERTANQPPVIQLLGKPEEAIPLRRNHMLQSDPLFTIQSSLPGNQAGKIDFDRMIKDIDRKIAELDEKERKQKESKESAAAQDQ